MLQKIIGEMKKNNLDVPLVAGGIIPKMDIPRLKEMGVAEVFGSGSTMERIVDTVKSLGSVEQASSRS